jgi:UDP:flavonoid glycosyltransferase YjiC (YdhE family)
MRVLFLPLITGGPAIGTITRCLAVADHLRKLGHEAFFLTNGEGAKFVSEAGYPAMKGTIPDPPGRHHPMHDLADVAVFLNLSDEGYIRRALDAERGAVDRFAPDVLFSEFKLTAPITAADTGLPLVSTACSPADPRFRSPLYPGERSLNHNDAIAGFNRVLSEHGQAPIEDVSELFFTRSDVKAAPTILELEPLLEDVPDLHYVGYLLFDRRELAPLPEGLIEATRSRDIVFVYFSTGEIGPDQYTQVIPQAFDGTEFHAVVAVGDHPELPELPQETANTTWLRFVPGRSILKCSRAAIFHGGQNTAMAALIHKVPSLIIPGKDFERDFNARAIDRIGAGIHLPVEDFTPERVLEGTRSLQSHSFQLAAETYGRKILRQGGPRKAANLLMKASRRAE